MSIIGDIKDEEIQALKTKLKKLKRKSRKLKQELAECLKEKK